MLYSPTPRPSPRMHKRGPRHSLATPSRLLLIPLGYFTGLVWYLLGRSVFFLCALGFFPPTRPFFYTNGTARNPCNAVLTLTRRRRF